MTRLLGLYAITPDDLVAEPLYRAVEQALSGGARILQYRCKTGDQAQRRRDARQLARLCRNFDALLIINDDVELTIECEAAGVHLGRHDAAPDAARGRLGPAAVIGVSCYNDLALARTAAAAGASYVAFGSFHRSGTKPHAVRAEPALLRQARSILRLPIVPTGGITPENGRPLIEAGADMLAVIQSLFAADDVRRRAAEFCQLFAQHEDSQP